MDIRVVSRAVVNNTAKIILVHGLWSISEPILGVRGLPGGSGGRNLPISMWQRVRSLPLVDKDNLFSKGFAPVSTSTSCARERFYSASLVTCEITPLFIFAILVCMVSTTSLTKLRLIKYGGMYWNVIIFRKALISRFNTFFNVSIKRTLVHYLICNAQ